MGAFASSPGPLCTPQRHLLTSRLRPGLLDPHGISVLASLPLASRSHREDYFQDSPRDKLETVKGFFQKLCHVRICLDGSVNMSQCPVKLLTGLDKASIQEFHLLIKRHCTCQGWPSVRHGIRAGSPCSARDGQKKGHQTTPDEPSGVNCRDRSNRDVTSSSGSSRPRLCRATDLCQVGRWGAHA